MSGARTVVAPKGLEPIAELNGEATPKVAAAPNGCCVLPSGGGTATAEGVA